MRIIRLSILYVLFLFCLIGVSAARDASEPSQSRTAASWEGEGSVSNVNADGGDVFSALAAGDFLPETTPASNLESMEIPETRWEPDVPEQAETEPEEVSAVSGTAELPALPADTTDLLFIGNSLVEGLRTAAGGEHTFLCKVGISLEGLKQEIYARIQSCSCRTVLIEMGTNELGSYTPDAFRDSYLDLIVPTPSVTPMWCDTMVTSGNSARRMDSRIWTTPRTLGRFWTPPGQRTASI